MSADNHPVILVEDEVSDAGFRLIHQAAPAARILRSEDLLTDPALGEAVEVCYGAPPDGLWSGGKRLKWVQVSLAGADGVLRQAEAHRHTAVITNVHIHAEAVSEHLWGMCLMLTRGLHRARDAQASREWDPPRTIAGLSSLAGRTLCVAGLGVIGRRCAALGKAFGMKVIGIRRSPGGIPVPEVDEVLGPGERRAAFARSRVIMLVLPDTPETRLFIGRDELAVMNGAFLLNAGRGGSVDTAAMVSALRDGRLRGAGLDVIDPEPLPAEHPLWVMPNVILTPHCAGYHPGYRERALSVFIDNLGRYLRGEPLLHVVDRERGY